MGLDIKVNNESLDLAGVKIPFTFNNPLFDEKNTDRAFSYSFTLKTTPRNKSILGHSERLDTTNLISLFSCEIIIDSSLHLRGNLIIKNRTAKNYKCYWTNEGTESRKKLSEIKITELDYEPVHLVTPDINWIFRYNQRYIDTVTGLGDRSFSIKINEIEFSFSIDSSTHLQTAFTDLKDRINSSHPGAASYGYTLYTINHAATATDPAYDEHKETHIFIINHLSPIADYTIEDFIWTNDGSGVTGTPLSQYHMTVLEEYDETTNPLYVGIGLPYTKAFNWGKMWTEINANLLNFDSEIKINPFSKPFCLPPFKNQGFYGDKNPEFLNYVNYYPYTYQILQTVEGEFNHNFTPLIFLKDVLKAIEDYSGKKIITGDIEEALKTIVFYNNNSLDDNYDSILPPTDFMEPKISTYPKLNRFNGFKEFVYIQEYLPDITASELIDSINVLFNRRNKVNENRTTLIKVVDIIKTKSVDWTSKSEEQYSFDSLNNEGYSLSYERDETDTSQNETAQLDGYNYKEGKMEINPLISTTKVISKHDELDTTRNWLIPEVNQNGKSKTLRTSGASNKPKFLIYHGHQRDSLGNDYPLLSNHYLDINGNRVGDLSLLLQGSEGIYESHYKDWLGFVTESKEVEKTIRLASHEINELIKWEAPIREIFHNKGNLKGIVKSIQFSADVNGISLSKVSLVAEGISQLPVIVQTEEVVIVTPPTPTVTTLIPGDGTTIWSLSGAAVSGLGFIKPTTTAEGWNKGGSFGTAPANTEFELTMTLTSLASTYAYRRYGMFGLGEVNSGGGYTNLLVSFQIAIQGAGTSTRKLYSRINGTSLQIAGTHVSYGDIYKIKRLASGAFEFYQNGTLLYTSTYINNNAMLFDCSMFSNLGMEDISIVY